MGVSDSNTVDITVRLKNARKARAEAATTGKSIRKMGDDVDHVGRRAELAEKRTNKFRGGVTALSRAAKLGALALTGMAVVVGKQAVTEFREAYKVTRQTEAVIKSTGGTANVTAKQVAGLSQEISNKVGIDDEEIQRGANMLLTFKDVRNEVGKGNDIFNQATQTVTDMSVALGQDSKNSAIQLGKALNDPIKGVTALQRVGVTFTEDQKKNIATMVESGNIMGAQKLILKELNSEFGGSAAAQADPIDKARVAWANLMETLGTMLAPTISKGLVIFATFVTQMQTGTGAGGKFVDVAVKIGTAIGTAAHYIGVAGSFISALFNKIGPPVVNFFKDLFDRIDLSSGDFQAFIKGLTNVGKVLLFVYAGILLKIVWPIVKRVLPGIRQMFQGLMIVIGGIVKIIGGILTGDFGKAWEGVKQIFRGALKFLGGFLRAWSAPARAVIAFIGRQIGSAFSSAWNAVKGVFKAGLRLVLVALKIGTAPIRLYVRLTGRAIVTGFNVIKSIPGFISGVLGRIVRFVKGMPSKIRSAARGMFDGFKTAFKSPINWIIDKWNSLEFKTPSVDPPGPGKFPSVTFGTPDIPKLGFGGVITRAGGVLVGDRGPEVLNLPRSASVRPLPAQRSLGPTQPIPREDLDGMFVSHTHLHLDGKEIAKNTTKHTSNDMARR